MPEFQDVRAVILAGGSGTRLWPLSRVQAPKQFLKLLGEETLLEATVGRLLPLIDAARVLVVTNRETASGEGFRVLEPFEKILEPCARNTAAAIGVAAVRYRLERIDPVLVVLPSDHLVTDVPSFQRALEVAVTAARSGALVTFGIRPTSPQTGFGYIHASPGDDIWSVASFHEKPDRTTAERFVASGNHFWNSGMFVWRCSAILDRIAKTLPSLAGVLTSIENDARASGSLQAAVDRGFGAAPSISIDHGVLEKTSALKMVPGEFGWSDVGSWDAVYDAASKDAEQNAIQGNVLAIECRNTLLRSHDRLVAAVGVNDISVVETSDAVLVTKRGESQNVRKVVEELARRAATEHVTPARVQRPWGSFTVLQEGPGFKIKHIEVRTGGRLSLQRHRHRSEHWVVVSGEATVTADSSVSTLRANESTFIPAGCMHRLENRAAAPLQIIEVQVGSYVGEDDIERFDDQYGRAKQIAPSP